MSTPIETNTEELQEILQQVYDLPNRNAGGSSEPDLVITVSDTVFENRGLHGSIEKFTYDSAKVISVYDKLISGQTVNCLLNGSYFPISGDPCKVSNPHISAVARNSAEYYRAGFVSIIFRLLNDFGTANMALVEIIFDILKDGTVQIGSVTACLANSFTSSLI